MIYRFLLGTRKMPCNASISDLFFILIMLQELSNLLGLREFKYAVHVNATCNLFTLYFIRFDGALTSYFHRQPYFFEMLSANFSTSRCRSRIEQIAM